MNTKISKSVHAGTLRRTWKQVHRLQAVVSELFFILASKVRPGGSRLDVIWAKPKKQFSKSWVPYHTPNSEKELPVNHFQPHCPVLLCTVVVSLRVDFYPTSQ